MNDEIPPPEVPGSPVPAQNQTPPAGVAAPPPTAELATKGEVTDERALALERRERAAEEREKIAREEETRLAERERKIQERESFAPPVKKVKRKPHWSDPVFNNGEDGDE